MAFRFREWQVYKDARLMRKTLKHRVLPKITKEEQYDLGSQLRRAMTSVILNIAEGSYRKSDKDFARFLNQSITSLYEVVSCLDLALDDGFINQLEHTEFLNQADSIAKQLGGFDKKLTA